MKTASFHVRRPEGETPLIEFLATRLSLSKSKAKDIIDRRCVFVNGRRVWMARHTLEFGDTVDVAVEGGAAPVIDRSIIVFADEDYLIANKPAGILSNGPHSLETALRTLLGQTTLEAIHRLDKDTSGCLLFSRHPQARDRIIPLFDENQIQKRYQAVVLGLITDKERRITKPISGQSAVTRIKTLDANRLASHLLITIETGRTHQIRKHLTGIGHPIIGDQIYATRRDVSYLERQIHRQMLHACEIKFRHPVKCQPVQGRAPVPRDFQTCLRLYNLH